MGFESFLPRPLWPENVSCSYGTPVGHSGPGQKRGSSVKFQVKREGPDILQSHSSSVARVDRPRTVQSPATVYPSAEPLQHADDDADEGSTGDSSMHSLFSAPSSPSRDPGISTPKNEKVKPTMSWISPVPAIEIPAVSHKTKHQSKLKTLFTMIKKCLCLLCLFMLSLIHGQADRHESNSRWQWNRW